MKPPSYKHHITIIKTIYIYIIYILYIDNYIYKSYLGANLSHCVQNHHLTYLYAYDIIYIYHDFPFQNSKLAPVGRQQVLVSSEPSLEGLDVPSSPLLAPAREELGSSQQRGKNMGHIARSIETTITRPAFPKKYGLKPKKLWQNHWEKLEEFLFVLGNPSFWLEKQPWIWGCLEGLVLKKISWHMANLGEVDHSPTWVQSLPSREPTFPTLGKGWNRKIIFTRALGWDMLVSRRVSLTQSENKLPIFPVIFQV